MQGRGSGLGVASAALALVLFTPARAFAEEPTDPIGVPPPGGPVVSLTLSAIHLVLPVAEVTAEVRVLPRLGVAAIVGAGSVRIDSNDPSVDRDRATAYELGGQIVGYPIATFRSLQVGAELLWLHLSLEEEAGGHVGATGQGLAVGPFLGYKVLTSSGFTFVAQGGAQFVAIRAETEDGSQSDQDDRVIGLINLNVGWSF